MSQVKTYACSEGVTLRTFLSPHFKTMRVSVNLLVPASEDRAAAYGLLPSLISRASRRYPSYTALGRRLAELYGAGLGSSVQKIGGYQMLGISVEGISGRYAFGGEDMFAELTGLLFDVIFDALKDRDGLYPLDGFLQEKRQQLEQKDSDFSDKMIYAHQRCHEILFEGSPAGIDRLGSRESIKALRREDLLGVWEELLSRSRIEISVLGDCGPDLEAFREKFSPLGKGWKLGPVPYTHPVLRRVTEEQPVAQSKLAMAFRADVPPGDRQLFQLMSAVLGEPVSSKLFLHVREDQGLCYYCDSTFSWANGTLFIESGVETGDLDRVEAAILEQLAAMRRGEITEAELRGAKLYLCNSLYSISDSLHRVEGWYLGQALSPEEELTPEQAAERLMKYTAADVAEAANRLRPAVVYRLKGSGCGWS